MGLAKSDAAKFPKQKSVLPILNNLRSTEPGLLGHSILAQHDVYSQLLKALKTLKAGKETKEFFVAVADLRHCYDQILHEPLLQRIRTLPLKAKYSVFQVSLQRMKTRPRSMEVALPDGVQLEEVLRSPCAVSALQRDGQIVVPKSFQVELTNSEAVGSRNLCRFPLSWGQFQRQNALC